jgi:hypothetical protein
LSKSHATRGHASGEESLFAVPSWLHAMGGFVHRHRSFWLWLARLESQLLAQELPQIAVRRPIFVCGLARSGSTLLHEIVSSHPGVATHRVKDYPMVFTPFWWRRATANQRPQAPRERPHRDGMMITTESPDAVEEMLWMAFFPRCHDPSITGVLSENDRNPGFETFYETHIRKLLLAEKATRYAAKNNYHIARLAYLIRLFPDARFLIPVRAPAGHIASLQRQQQWFAAGHRQHPRALAYMQRSGHFEFGLDRRPMHLGEANRVQQVIEDWATGNEIQGLARYWDMVHGYLARLLAADAQVRASALVVRYETMCAAPVETLRAVLDHCMLPDHDAIVERYAPSIRFPTYYQSKFSTSDLDVIQQETATSASEWGY